MDETSFSLDADKLSAEDLAVIQAFDALDDLQLPEALDDQAGGQEHAAPISLLDGSLAVESSEDMLILFASEADEDIAMMKRTVEQLEQDDQNSAAVLVALGRIAHKLKGTAGAMGFDSMSAIALQIEEEIQLIKDEKMELLTGIVGLTYAVNALETTLSSVMHDGQESPQPLQELLQDLAQLQAGAGTTSRRDKAEDTQELARRNPPLEVREASPVTSMAQIDLRYLNALLSHTEHLIELHAPLESAQKQVAKYLVELQAAHGRLRRLEGLLSSITLLGQQPSEQNQPAETTPASSLIARIVQEARQRASRQAQGRRPSVSPAPPASYSAETALWDEMEMDRFTEHKILLQTFSEAVADVATASTQLRGAFAQLNTLVEQQVRQTSMVRNDALRLRSAPFSALLARVQRAVQEIAQTCRRSIQFETAGETTEIDQDVLEFLAGPLLQLIRTSVTDSLLSLPDTPHQTNQIWLKAQQAGNEILIELGFSMPVPGGALETLRGPVQQLHGGIAAQRNSAGGVSYQLRFPRTQGMIQGLLVQAGGQGLVLPLSQIHLVDYQRQETYTQIYHLASLLGFPHVTGNLANPLPPVIILAGLHRRVGLQVDEIIGETELVMKPLAPHMQRPGIVGTSVDGSGNVLLILDLHTLIHDNNVQRRSHPQRIVPLTVQPAASEAGRSVKILVADDSVYMRQSLRHTFEHAGYQVMEARDGIEALEYFTSEQAPDILLLDIEMPNLNGYDLLNILHSQPGLAECKTILLTSRSSEKHRQRAMELGAFAFLSKPCAQDVLLDTVLKALADTSVSF